ncbi:MAG: hypothetical protein Q9168_002131 [Polycauliona sp. 1 TL-2023]
MVHYIRFLKPPRVTLPDADGTHGLLSTLLTITTDLGDAFYSGHAYIYSGIFSGTATKPFGITHWEPGMRVVKIEAKVPLEFFVPPFRFMFTCNESLDIELLHIEQLPRIMSAWTEEFSFPEHLDTKVTVRRLRLPDGRLLEICEENGESMARHIWDGGVVLAAWLVNCPEFRQPPGSRDVAFAVVELGTGCGTVGLAFGMWSDCKVLLTDVDEDALVYARLNARGSRAAFNRDWECQPLDWSETGPMRLVSPLDFIIASECIYNPDTIPDLVRTISSLVQHSNRLKSGSRQPRIIVSTKVRHSSEAAFFDLMKEAGFAQKQHEGIPIPDQYRESIGQDLEVVHIYIFEKQGEANSSPEKSGYEGGDEEGGSLLESCPGSPF